MPIAYVQRCVARLLAVSPLLLAANTGCTPVSVPQDADIIVVGAGIAGLAAALEAADNGARVLVIEASSVGGGHAVKAGGFALVNTALQRAKGIEDDPGIAINDWINRGVDPDIYWTSQYAENSAADVYDWLSNLGVEFKLVLPTQEDSVPRFHFTSGTAVNAVVPMLQSAMRNPDIDFIWNTRVTALAKAEGKIIGVFTRNERDGSKQQLRAAAVILATGGFQNNLDQVRQNWPAEKATPERLFAGAGQYATGDGYRMAAWAGGDIRHKDRHVIFYNGIPDPRDGSGSRALHAQNPAAIWVNKDGRRFIDESTDDKAATIVVEQMDSTGYWLIFDARGARRFGVRDAPWLNSETVRTEVLNNPAITQQANSLGELASKAGLSSHGLITTVQTWNRMIEFGEDFSFGRFRNDDLPRGVAKIKEAPFYAVRTYAMTRKNLGGPAISLHAQVIDANKQAIAGLYAAGELTGVAGINGQFGGAGTFLGPSVYMGRIAGRHAAEQSLAATDYAKPALSNNATSQLPTPTAAGQPGYWHYDSVHALVAERSIVCSDCHTGARSMQPALDANAMLARLGTCTNCH